MKKVWLHSKKGIWSLSNSVGLLQMWKAVGIKLTTYAFVKNVALMGVRYYVLYHSPKNLS